MIQILILLTQNVNKNKITLSIIVFIDSEYTQIIIINVLCTLYSVADAKQKYIELYNIINGICSE